MLQQKQAKDIIQVFLVRYIEFNVQNIDCAARWRSARFAALQRPRPAFDPQKSKVDFLRNEK